MTKIGVDLIQKLRNMTGLGMMDCKKALVETEGDVEKAVDLLRKKGAAVAAKRGDKETKAGLVYAYIHPGSQVGVMVEINCETDFVARTEDVQELAKDLCMHIAAIKPLYLEPSDMDPKFLEHEKEIFTDQLKEAGKPEGVIAKILVGKVQKLYKDVCLIEQPFVKNDKLTVAQKVEEVIGKVGEKIKIKKFARFEVGL
ncbi:translation elongation factor Ts [bacterium]|jgi:elongation factor Ts|nr:translation elongation factor Ts [bacterium]